MQFSEDVDTFYLSGVNISFIQNIQVQKMKTCDC